MIYFYIDKNNGEDIEGNGIIKNKAFQTLDYCITHIYNNNLQETDNIQINLLDGEYFLGNIGIWNGQKGKNLYVIGKE